MENITIAKLTDENFSLHSMDHFIRFERITQFWKKVHDQLVLTDSDYILDWDLEKRRDVAHTIQQVIQKNGYAYGAFSGNSVVGYILVSKDRFGSRAQYFEVCLFHISASYRRKGLGKELFKLACFEARRCGAEKLYISSGPAKGTQEAYRKLGCIPATEINPEALRRNPGDIQLEYVL